MYAGALCRRQVINAPPTHLQENKGDDEQPQGQTGLGLRKLAVMDIDEIGEPGDGSPSLIGVP